MTSATDIDPWRPWRAIADKLTLIPDRVSEELVVERLRPVNVPVTVGFLNTHALNSVLDNLEFCENLCDLDFLFRDGAGASIFMRVIGASPGLNMNGTDLIPCLLRKYARKKVAVLGTREPYLSQGIEHIENRFDCKVVLRMHGFLDMSDYLEAVRKYAPDFVYLGMGMPKQESVAALLKKELGYPCLITCGGGLIDIWGGRLSRSPKWLRLLRLEWLYRYFQEPIRTFGRYIIGNPLLVLRAIRFGIIVRREKRIP